MMDDLKQRLSGDVDYGAWHDLNAFAYEKGWIWDAHVSDRNVFLISAARDDDRPDLLIPVALSMVPDGCRQGVLADATYPAAALALAVIAAREVEQ